MSGEEKTRVVGASTGNDADVGMARRAYQLLRDMVRRGDVAPGELLSEQKLAAEFGLGRTPIREAVSRLVHEGVLERLPKRGVRVCALSIEEMHDLYELREWLEVQCARQAVTTMADAELDELRAQLLAAEAAVAGGCSWVDYRDWDERFHTALWQASGNRRVVDLLGSLHDASILDATYQLDVEMPGQGMESIAGHTAILDGIASRDPDVAAVAVEQHTRSYRTQLASRILGGSRRRRFA